MDKSKIGISHIVAISRNNQLILDNDKEFHCKEDMKRFKALTIGKVCIMGRKTYESIGKPLKNRLNIIISKTLKHPHPFTEHPLVLSYRTIEEGIAAAKIFIDFFNMPREIMIIGGGEIYNQTLHLADTLYITFVDKEYNGNINYPQFKFVDFYLKNSENLHPDFDFNTYKRITTLEPEWFLNPNMQLTNLQ